MYKQRLQEFIVYSYNSFRHNTFLVSLTIHKYVVNKQLARKLSRLPSQKTSATAASTAVRWSPWRWYQTKISTYPVATKCITSGVIYGMGDMIAQKAASPQSTIDKHRTLRGMVYGSVFVAPLAHLHFNFLQWLVVTKFCVRTSLVPFVKVFFDQFVYWAPSIVCIYHISMGVMEGLTFDQCIQRLRAIYWQTLKANWMLWAPLMVLNFRFIPVAHQLNFCLMVGMTWACIISYIRGNAPTIVEEKRKPILELEKELDHLPHCSGNKIKPPITV